MKAYLLVYSSTLGSRDEVKQCLNALDNVVTWRYDLPSSFYLLSEETEADLARSIREYMGHGRFIITEISPNCQGWLTPDSWYFINQKAHRPKS